MQDATRYYAMMDSRECKALATEDGKTFTKAGFEIAHTGGGCMAWQRDIDSDWFVWITDSSGTELTISANEPDCWFIGIHSQDGAFSEAQEAQTATEALAIADRIAAQVRSGNFEGLDIQ